MRRTTSMGWRRHARRGVGAAACLPTSERETPPSRDFLPPEPSEEGPRIAGADLPAEPPFVGEHGEEVQATRFARPIRSARLAGLH